MLGSDNLFVHLITICAGLIIAFGLQQIVGLFLRRRQRQQGEAAAQASKSSDNPPPPQSITPPQ